MKLRLTPEQVTAMLQVAYGGDVYNRETAERLREVERNFPHYINIGVARFAPRDGAKKQPYFGAILTASGLKAAAR